MGEDSTRIHDEIESLRQMSTAQLKAKYREVFGEETRSNHKQFLFRRIAWRIQANAGGLSERAPEAAQPELPSHALLLKRLVQEHLHIRLVRQALPLG